MCGIAGFIDPTASAEARIDAIGRMRGAMRHRGPDDAGLVSHGAATFGMRRLAIFDPEHGHQPMLSPDRRFAVVFNGAIYNFRSLRAELAADWSFRTECDTEVLLAAYVRWGEDCVGRLRGMFAFGVWDDRMQSLFLARDAFGIKPLYYSHRGSRLLFASELNALVASQLCPPDIDPVAVADYLAWLAVPAPRTIYRGLFSLRPGECLTFRDGQLALRSHWSFQGIGPQPVSRTRGEFLGALRERLEDSIRAHVLADVPVGAFLSGGVDSAAVVGLMTRVTASQLRTFSIDFAEPRYSEAPRAEATARHYGTAHQSTLLQGADVAGEVETLLGNLDQPTGDGINTYYASKAARAGGVTVALSGLGGDELFGGYPSFRDMPRLARWLPRWHRLPAGGREWLLRRFRGGDTRQRKLADFLQHARSLPELAALQRRVFSDTSRRSLLDGAALAAVAAASPFHPELDRLSADLAGADTFDTISAWELRTYMADVLLRDSDVMSMRHSLELRVPLIDRPLVEWLRHQPSGFKADNRGQKTVLTEALADVLPPGMGDVRKRGFTLPMDVWMKRELRPFLDETFSDASVGRSGMFSAPAVQQLWQDFLAGNDSRRWSRVWSLAVLIAFVNRRRPTWAGPATRVSVLTSTTKSAAASGSCERQRVESGERQRVESREHQQHVGSSAGGSCERQPLDKLEALQSKKRLAVSLSNQRVDDASNFARSRERERVESAFSAEAQTHEPASESVVCGPLSVVPATRSQTLFLAPEIFASEGGIPRILQTYLQALCELAGPRGSVRLLALNDASISAADLRPYASGRLDAVVGCDRRKAKFVREALRLSRGCERIVCGHVFQLPVAWLAQRLNPRLRYYLVAHGIEVWRRFTLKERVALRSAERIFCVSDYTRRELLKNCPLPGGVAVVLHNALDPAFLIEPGRPLSECPPVILTVTRLTSADRYKGVQHLIEAMPAIRAAIPDARLRIIGRGDDQPRLAALSRSLGLEGAVEFTGYVDDARLAEELRTCRLFALPSRKEGFGLVFLEAMAKGRPCVGANAGGIPEVISAATGMLVEYGDVSGLAVACVESLRRDWNGDAIVAHAQAFAYPEFKSRLGELLAA